MPKECRTKLSAWRITCHILLQGRYSKHICMDILCKKTKKYVCNKLCEVIVDMKCNNHINRGQHTSVWSPGVSPTHIIQGPKCYSAQSSIPCIVCNMSHQIHYSHEKSRSLQNVCIWFLITLMWLDISMLNSKNM